jgi:SAM-dependent methyltransferase
MPRRTRWQTVLFNAKFRGMATRLIFSKTWRKRLKRLPFSVRLVRLIRYLIDPQERSIVELQKTPQSKLLQPSAVTYSDRYPELFRFVQAELKEFKHPRILSYGCSTGEEVFSLKGYLPGAAIKGIEINPYSIQQGQKRLAKMPTPDITFALADSPAREPTGHYDAIFCLAVLRHGELDATMPERCDAYIKFNDVAELVADLARCLKQGGLMAIKHSHFRFVDFPVASQFEVVWAETQRPGFKSPLYGSDNKRLNVPPYCDAVFRKRRT